MPHKSLNRIFGSLAFLIPMIMYAITVAPTVVFWDVGEFIAASWMMQVPHPPGSPLFLFLTRLAMMVPVGADLAMRAHLFSALLSALGVMFTYLVIVRFILKFRGTPETLADKITMYGSAFIGAMTLAFSTSYWDNAIEAEVYGASVFFLSSIMWLALRWDERWQNEGSEKYILLIAYLIGLSLGVHLLALLAIFPVFMIMYFRKFNFSMLTFLILMVVMGVSFATVYPGIVKKLPSLIGREGAPRIFAVLFIVGALAGSVWSFLNKKKTLHIALLSLVLIFFGYTTYTSVIIRANQNPPMNENDPSTLPALTAYLGREQYGDQPILNLDRTKYEGRAFPRRYSQEPQHQGIYTTYKSDTDFFIRYQLNHMFFRYIGWNFVGVESDVQDSGITWKDTWGIPLLIGLFGLWYHFNKDWKMGLTLLTAFIILGPALALYQNQQEPQPRERDYFYVGAYFIYTIWIAFGIVGIIDLLRKAIPDVSSLAIAGASVLLFMGAIPANLARVNFESHDHRGDFVAWDYSYNILQTCEKDAILFTNGDNDTFPLWYLQDVEGVRRDVRIVNLSLVNTDWYIKQMKMKPYYPEAKAVPISLSDQEIAQIQPVQFQTQLVSLPVPREVYKRFGLLDAPKPGAPFDTAEVNKGKLEFTMRHTLQFGNVTAIRVQDIMVQDIIFTNKWGRPIYFAVTCSPDSKIGLDDYLWFNGLAWRLEPHKVTDPQNGGVNIEILETNIFNEPKEFSKAPQYGYKFRGINDPDVYYDENSSRLTINYRSAFLRYALYYSNIENKPEKALAGLDRMEHLIPRKKIPMGWDLTSSVAGFYHRLGKVDKYNELMAEVEPECVKAIERGEYNVNAYENPFRILLELYETRRENAKAIELLKKLQALYPNDPSLQQRIAMHQAQLSGSDTTRKN